MQDCRTQTRECGRSHGRCCSLQPSTRARRRVGWTPVEQKGQVCTSSNASEFKIFGIFNDGARSLNGSCPCFNPETRLHSGVDAFDLRTASSLQTVPVGVIP